MRADFHIYIVFQIFIYTVFLFIWNIIDKALKKYYMGSIFTLWRGSQVPVPYFQTFDWGPGISLLYFQGGEVTVQGASYLLSQRRAQNLFRQLKWNIREEQLYPFTYFVKPSILDNWHGSEYDSGPFWFWIWLDKFWIWQGSQYTCVRSASFPTHLFVIRTRQKKKGKLFFIFFEFLWERGWALECS